MSMIEGIQPARSLRGAVVTSVAIVAAAIAWPGCGREERGPELLGGRAVKSWVADLNHPKATTRRQAVIKLSNVGAADPAVASGLVAALDDRDALVRRDAILAVARLKYPPQAAKERLETMSRSDQDARARDLAGKAVVFLNGHK